MKGKPSDSVQGQVGRLLRALALLVEKIGPEEALTLLNDPSLLSKAKNRPSNGLSPLHDKHTPSPGLSELAGRLNHFRSRDEGMALLASANLTRRDLENLGRIIGIPILKTDNVERLTLKIIEASIGSRLSSEAIRGDRPKAGK